MTTKRQENAHTAEKIHQVEMSTLRLSKLSTLWFPIMLAEQAGEITEMAAVQLLGLKVTQYRKEKRKAINVVSKLATLSTSPLSLLLESMKDRQKS
jgi:hypothetical protein